MDQLLDLLARATELIDSLSQLVVDSPLTYLVIFAMAALDVLAPILPAEATVTAAAVLAGQGRLEIVWVMLAAGLGAFVGDNVAYWIGRAAGRPLVERVLRGNTAQLEAVEEQFHRRGGTFVIIGRFVPGGRTAVAIGAGVLHFRWARFVLYDAIAALVWSVQAALPGFVGGALIADRPWLAMLLGFVLSALLATTIALLQRWRAGRQVPEVPVRPAVVGIGSASAHLDIHPHALAASGPDGASAATAGGDGVAALDEAAAPGGSTVPGDSPVPGGSTVPVGSTVPGDSPGDGTGVVDRA